MTLQDKIIVADLQHVTGFRAGGVSIGLRKSGRPDFAMIVSDTDCTLAAVFTTNQVKAAPVLYNMERLQHNASRIRAVVTNAANANACTGEQGLMNSRQTAAWVAAELGIEPEQVLVQSTGVIGVQLPMEKFASGIPVAVAALDEGGWAEAAHAIMTTDTRPKAVSRQCAGYTITAIAKGSGMIAPNMATMLAMIVTDARIPQPALQTALSHVNQVSFNCISVDGDTSTNDTVLLLANGATGVEPDLAAFEAALMEVCTELAHMIVRDGEGATKFITIAVSGAPDDTSAHAIANTIATSPLVKTAFYGSDANWGRIVAAAGRAGVALDPTAFQLWFDALQVVANGTPTGYQEAEAATIFAQEEITVQLVVGAGQGQATVWTCDFSHEYVSINADYRT